MSINSGTGAISFTPTVAGQVAVICVRADEYRNGTLIGSVVRDMQVIIQSCNNALAPSSTEPTASSMARSS